MRPHRRQPTRLLRPGILQKRTLEWITISYSFSKRILMVRFHLFSHPSVILLDHENSSPLNIDGSLYILFIVNYQPYVSTCVLFLNFILMWTIFKVFVEFVTILFLFYVFLASRPCKLCGFLALPTRGWACLALEGKVLTTGQPGKSLNTCFISHIAPKHFFHPPSLLMTGKQFKGLSFLVLPVPLHPRGTGQNRRLWLEESPAWLII